MKVTLDCLLATSCLILNEQLHTDLITLPAQIQYYRNISPAIACFFL